MAKHENIGSWETLSQKEFYLLIFKCPVLIMVCRQQVTAYFTSFFLLLHFKELNVFCKVNNFTLSLLVISIYSLWTCFIRCYDLISDNLQFVIRNKHTGNRCQKTNFVNGRVLLFLNSLKKTTYFLSVLWMRFVKMLGVDVMISNYLYCRVLFNVCLQNILKTKQHLFLFK